MVYANDRSPEHSGVYAASGNQGQTATADPTKKIVTIPVAPDSIAAAVGGGILGRITSELAKTDTTLSGSGTPGDDDETGVIKKGENLLTALKRIGQK